MRKAWLAVVLILSLLFPLGSFQARQRGSHRSSASRSRASSRSRVRTHRVKSTTRARRDKHGRIKRSRAARDAFKHQHPCPSTGRRSGGCPGYVIDHINPLACGGADEPSNMQWQTKAEAQAKDRWERKGCR